MCLVVTRGEGGRLVSNEERLEMPRTAPTYEDDSSILEYQERRCGASLHSSESGQSTGAVQAGAGGWEWAMCKDTAGGSDTESHPPTLWFSLTAQRTRLYLTTGLLLSCPMSTHLICYFPNIDREPS